MAKKVIIAYVPVIHAGYQRLFEASPAFHSLFILGHSITQAYRPLQKEIRALDPTAARQLLQGWNLFDDIQVIEENDLKALSQKDVRILMPDEDVSHDIAQRYFSSHDVQYSPLFLRWDRRRAEALDPVSQDMPITVEELHRSMMKQTGKAAHRSSNIWRRVGAVLAKDGRIIASANNTHRPSPHSPWIDGDVRAQFGKGVGIEMSTDQHAESCVIAEAARQGIALEAADLYVTTFPCPPCAMLIAYSGIKRLFFAQGYAVLDGKRILEEQDVTIIKVDIKLADDPDETYRPYPDVSGSAQNSS